MSELNSVARPYAKAAFEHALQSKALDKWSEMLNFAAVASADAALRALLDNPRVAAADKKAALIAVCEGRLPDGGKSFLELLADNQRLAALAEISVLFEVEKARHEKTATVQITSAANLSDAEKKALTDKLASKWGKKINATFSVDANLIGGAVIRSDDVVIDGSVRGKLQRLATTVRV
jgi:F-type H+-transporting ATPase subunit delta